VLAGGAFSVTTAAYRSTRTLAQISCGPLRRSPSPGAGAGRGGPPASSPGCGCSLSRRGWPKWTVPGLVDTGQASPASGRCPHVRQDLGGVGLTQHRHRPLLPESRRLDRRHAHADQPGHRDPRHGPHAQKPPPGVIFCSDRGAQYTSKKFDAYCRRHNIRRSLGRTGARYDNAVAESFFATYKKELVHTRPWPTPADLRNRTQDWIENSRRRRPASMRSALKASSGGDPRPDQSTAAGEGAPGADRRRSRAARRRPGRPSRPSPGGPRG
jgi:transposase InsO family protein